MPRAEGPVRVYPLRMRGSVAGGHALTARAGAQVLEAGGNAVDAAVAAALVSWVAESPLTGPGAGGFMLVHRARDKSTRVFDFFVAIPGLGDETGAHELYTGELGAEIVKHVRAGGGSFTQRDLNEYRVIRRRPVRARFCGEEFFSNPPPSRGGVLIAYGLPLLEELGVGKPGSAE